MAVSLREYRARIKSVESTKKITRAMELIAASRIIKAQQRAQSAAPYDRGLAGAYSSGVLKEAERLRTRLEDDGKDVDIYISGRKGVAYYRFRGREVVESWTGHSDQPSFDVAHAMGAALIGAFLNDEDSPQTVGEGDDAYEVHPGVDEVHVVYTQF